MELSAATIHKIFGAKVQGGMGLALTLLERASMINWEALWPQFQKAMIGLGVAAIATIQGMAIRKGLSELAERIVSFQPTVSPMPGEPLTWAEIMPVPYVPVFPEMVERIKEYPPISLRAPTEAEQRIELRECYERYWRTYKTLDPNDPDFCEKLRRLIEAMGYDRMHVYPDVTPPRPSLYLRLSDLDVKYCVPKRRLQWQKEEERMTRAEREALEYRDAGPY